MQINTYNQRGFTAIEIVIGVVIVLALGGVGWRVYDSMHDSKNKSQASVGQKDSDGEMSNETQESSADGISPASPAHTDTNGDANSSRSGSGSSPKTNTSSPTTTSPTTTTPGSSNNVTPSPTSSISDTPQVTLTYPSSWGQTVSGTITLTATASDSNGITKVIFYVNRIGYATPVFTHEDTTAPYSAQFDTTTLPNGGSDYSVAAQAFDSPGHGNSASYRINIQN